MKININMKIRIFLLFVSAVVLFACDSAKNNINQEISKLETEVEEQATAQSVSNLFAKYEQFVKEYPDDAEMGGRYMYRSAGLAYRAGNYQKAASYLERGINDFPKSSITPGSRVLLGSLYDENLNQPDKAKTLFQYVVDNHPDHEGADRARLFFKPEDVKLQTLIGQQEEILRDENNNIKPRIAADLYGKYAAYAERFPDDKTNAPNYLFKSGELLSYMNNPAAAAKSYEKILSDHKDSKVVPDTRLLLAGIYDDHLNKSEDALEQAKIFISENSGHPDLDKAKYYLKPEDERLNTRITELEAGLSPEGSAKIDLAVAGKLIRKYETYVKKYPKGNNAANYLYKAGEVARSTNNARKAVELLERVYSEYRKYDKAPQALFLAGFIYENDLRDLDKAKEIYESFMKEYPQHELAKSVEFSLANLGKPADEIIKSFEGKE